MANSKGGYLYIERDSCTLSKSGNMCDTVLWTAGPDIHMHPMFY